MNASRFSSSPDASLSEAAASPPSTVSASAAALVAAGEAPASADSGRHGSSSSGGGGGGGPLSNLRKGYRVLRQLLTPKPVSNRRSQLPFKLPRFADPLTAWGLALVWLGRVTERLGPMELQTPVFDRHGCFERLEARRPSLQDFAVPAATTASAATDAKRRQLLTERLLQLAGSGHLLRALADRLLDAGADQPHQQQQPQSTVMNPPTPRQDLLLLPLSFETATGHHHHHSHHLNLHLHSNHHQHHHQHQNQQHLPPQAQAGLAVCEENFAAFHKFLARVLGGSEAADATGGCELRVALGKQCAECNAVCLLLHQHHHQHQQSKRAAASGSADGSSGRESALSVLLLHLLTLMLLLGEPLAQRLRSEVLQLWERRLQPSSMAQAAAVVEIRRSYSKLMLQAGSK